MTEVSDIGCVILGAGFSRRFGGDKRAALLGNKTVATTTLETYCSVFSNTRLVLREEDKLEQLGIDLNNMANLNIVRAPMAHKGMGHSLSAGFAGLSWTWAFVGLLDMPFISKATLVALIAHAKNSSAPLVQPRLMDTVDTAEADLERRHGHPLGIHRQLFNEVRASSGDQGARRLVTHRASQIDYFDCGDTGVIRDIDYPNDLSRQGL
jgi:molybdenum cofactor cytidylyltransferase